MRKIIFATKNKGKLKEIKAILGDLFEIQSMEEAGIDIDVIEDGTTFEQNAVKKAVEIMEICGQIVLADDSGLEIDFLDKQPGVYSARYMGEDTPYDIKNNKILELLKDVPESERSARFVCAIAAAVPNEQALVTTATVEGCIGHEIAGENGFGYDPIFYVPEYKLNIAELPLDEKNKISHRGKALRQMKELLLNRARG